MKKLTLALWALVAAAAPLAAGQEWWRGGECGSVCWLTHKMHWPQSPADIEDGVNPRLDVSLGRVVLADDFVCTETGPIQYIVIWGGFLNNVLPEGGSDSLTFELSIYADVPATGDNWSRPGRQMWTRIFDPGQYTRRTEDNRWTEAWYDPADGVYLPERAEELQEREEYSFCIEEEPFVQEQGTIYWLAVRDLSADPNEYTFGWTTTGLEKRWNDRAVYLQTEDEGWIELSYPEEHRLVGQPLGLAFVIGNGEASPKHDLGDAPDSSNSVAGATMTAYDGVTAHYPTVYNAGSPPYGPMHLMPRDRFYLGDAVSLENEADIGLDGDDPRFDHIGKSGPVNNLDGPLNWPDLDGHDDGLVRPLQFPSTGQSTTLDYRVTVVDPGTTSVYVNVWCDWNRDGDWDDTLVCPDGELVPEWAVRNDIPAFARAGHYGFTSSPFKCWHPDGRELDPLWVRITIAEQKGTGHGAGPVGGYQYGETEDYVIQLFDWGDAPDDLAVPGYPTLAANNGARHGLAKMWPARVPGPWLGGTFNPDWPDAEPDGQPDEHALGDDAYHGTADDEDGVSIPPMIPGLSTDATVEVNGGGGIVQVWVDFNADRAWSDEEMVLDGFLADGIHVFSFQVPGNAVVGTTFARARISTAGHLNPDGPAADGEVEDHEVQIVTAPPTILPGAVTMCPAVETMCPVLETGCPPVTTKCPMVGTACPGAVTECPVTETQCPVAETHCPAEQTKCPPVATYCPAEQTTCPTRQTYCPADQTKCPPGPTYCPAELTQCPPSPTYCPAELTKCPTKQTYCPAEQTKCPPSSTKCPESATKCPLTVTQCQSVSTECPAVPTYCPAEDTKCPPTSPTKCPVEETKCPPVSTQCPAKETHCPSTATLCRVVDTQCPAKATRCPTGGLTTCPICGLGSLRSDAEEAAVFGVLPCPIVESLCPTIGEYLAIAEARL